MPRNEESINIRIVRYRTLAGYTQQTAADAIGMNKNSYARMERSGTPKPEVLKKLAALFNVSAETILYGEEKKDYPFAESEKKAATLKDVNHTFKQSDPLLLTTNEKTIIKLCRSLSPEQRNKIMKYIVGFVNEAKTEEKQ